MSDDKLRKPTLEEAEEVAKILADSPEVLAAFVGADGIREGLKTERRNKLEVVQSSPSVQTDDPRDIEWAREFIGCIEGIAEEWQGDGPFPGLSVSYEALRRKLREVRMSTQRELLLEYACLRNCDRCHQKIDRGSPPPGFARRDPDPDGGDWPYWHCHSATCELRIAGEAMGLPTAVSGKYSATEHAVNVEK